MFSIDGVSDFDLGITALSGFSPRGLPDTREKTMEIPGRDGIWDFGADLSVRTFEIPCAIVAETRETMQATIRKIAGSLIDRRGKPKTLKLVFDWDPDVTYYVRYSGSMAITDLLNLMAGSFSLSLKATDPYGYGPDVSTEKGITTSGDSITVNNAGNVEILPTITVKNEGSNTILGFNINSLYYSGSLAPGDSVVINSKNFTLVKNGENDLKNMSGDFPSLNVGEDLIIYSDSGSSRTVNVKIDYNLRWI